MANEEVTVNPEWVHDAPLSVEEDRGIIQPPVRETGSTPQEMEENEKRQYLTEQYILNNFIRENVGINFDAINSIDSKYVKSDTKVQRIYADTAFEIWNAAYQKDSAENERIKNMPFQNYVKLYNPSKIFQDNLRNPAASKDSPAWFVHDIFNSDIGLVRLAVLDAYQRKIEDQQGR